MHQYQPLMLLQDRVCPFKMATTPVLATPDLISNPNPCSFSTIYFMVLDSLLESSGYWCKCLRHAMTESLTSFADCSILACVICAPAKREGPKDPGKSAFS